MTAPQAEQLHDVMTMIRSHPNLLPRVINLTTSLLRPMMSDIDRCNHFLTIDEIKLQLLL